MLPEVPTIKFPSLSLLMLVACAGLAMGCGSEGPDATSSNAEILSFKVTPEILAAPAEVKVSWETSGGASIQLELGDEEVELGDAGILEGEVQVFVEESSVVTLVVTDSKGRSVEASLPITLDESAGPTIATFDVPEFAEAGESGRAEVTVEWSGVANAEALVLERAGHESVVLDPMEAGGSVAVEIEADTTFTLLASNAAGEARLSGSVKLVRIPSIETFASNRSRAGTGEEVALSWSTANAIEVQLWLNEARVEGFDSTLTSGEWNVEVQFDSTLELRAINEVGTTVSETLDLTVGLPIIQVLNFSATELWLGETLEIDWQTAGGGHLDVSYEGAEEALCESADYAEIAESNCLWTPTDSGIYSIVLTVTNSSGVASESAEIFVDVGPLLERFSVSPAVLNAGGKVDFSWNVLPDPAGNQPTLSLTDDRGNDYPITSEAGEGDAVLTVAGTYLFTLEATTDDPRSSAKTATATVEVHALPVVQLAADPMHFDDAVADEVVVSWATANAASLVLHREVDGPTFGDGQHEEIIEIPAGEIAQGSRAFVLRHETIFRLVAVNEIGGTTEETLTVTLAPTELLSFDATPTALTQGQPVTFSWVSQMADEVKLDLIGKTYLLEEIAAPYVDVENEEGEHLPMTAACGASISAGGCATLTFPTGFLFPFGGVDRTELVVYTNGVITFDANAAGNLATSAILRLPTNSANSWIHLAPFWEELAWDTLRYPQGNIFFALNEGAAGKELTIQWKDVGLRGFERASFNFEVVLHESGAFEYRYGTFSKGDTNLNDSRVNAESVAIGFQLPDLSDGESIYYRAQVPVFGSPSYRTFSYRPAPTLDRSGTVTFSPYTTRTNLTATLTATRDAAVKSQSVTLTFSRKPSIEFTPAELAPVLIDEEFLLGWKVSNAEKVTILDQDGVARCTITNEAEIMEGLCPLSESESGVHEYTLRAEGSHGYIHEQKIPVTIYGDFGVFTFTADQNPVEKGTGVLLSWATFNAVGVTLFQDGVEILSLNQGGVGSHFVQPIDKEETFTLRAIDEFGVTDEATLTVGIWDIDFTLTSTATVVRPGQPVTVTVGAKTRAGGDDLPVFGMLPLVEETGAAHLYSDISGIEGATQFTINTVTNQMIELPFPFPYLGNEYTTIWATIHGYASFRDVSGVKSTNAPLPTLANDMVHLAPFWAWLTPWNTTATPGEMWAARVGDSFVIQWSKMSMLRASTAQVHNNLNFQVVLFPDGSFEYRYGTMAGGNHSSCRPTTDCANEANGAIASIGYQSYDGTKGHDFHYGGAVSGDDNQQVFGGLSNRTFRYPRAAGTQTFTFHPNKTESFEFCALSAGSPVCKALQIEAEFGLTSVNASKDVIPAGGATTFTWQSEGGSKLQILQGDQVVFETEDLGMIASGFWEARPENTSTYHVTLRAGARFERVTKLIEVEKVSLTSSVTPAVVPGGEATISWTLNKVDPAAEPYIIAPMEETNAYFYEFDLSDDPDADLLMGPSTSGTSNLNVNLVFKNGFVFPYFGVDHTSLRVTTDGTIGTATAGAGNNAELPAANHAGKLLLPFWDDLHPRAQGSVFAKAIGTDRYVIQWHKMSLSYGSAANNQGSLNFMVVLHRDGSFEYRYGPMAPPPLPPSGNNLCFPASCLLESNGSSASIGYLDPTGTAVFLQHYGGVNRGEGQMPVAGGLSDRSWKYTPTRGSGSMKVYPTDTTQYTVCAYIAENQEISCAPTVEVEAPWGIDLFVASDPHPLPGGQISLNWKVNGADALRILEDGVEIHFLPAGFIPPMGSHSVTVNGAREYTLEVDSLLRTRTASLTVTPRTFDLVVTGPTGKFFPGETVTLEWELTKHGSGDVAMVTPLTEIPAGPGTPGAFFDISGLEGATPLVLGPTVFTGSARVQIPFPFPYLETVQVELDAYAAGYISFAGFGGNSNASNSMLPIDTAQGKRIQLAVFWAGQTVRGADKIYTYSPDANTFIVQWTNFNLTSGSSASAHYDLNYQVVLRRDGSFEYRYGEMKAPAQPFFSDDCQDGDCVLEANGSTAAIGYQNLDGDLGSTLHLGSFAKVSFGEQVGGSASDGYLGFPGGLSNRSFAYNPVLKGSSSLVVGRTSTFEVCGLMGTYAGCESVVIEARADLGDLAITELMIDPAGGIPVQWFEVRNLNTTPLDLAGFEIATKGGSHIIQGPLVVPGGGFITLASSDRVGFVPDYIYGEEVPLDRLIDTLDLRAGSASIATVKWGVGWQIPSNQTLSLDSSFHQAGLQKHGDFAEWCSGGSQGSPGSIGLSCIGGLYSVDPVSSRPFIDISTTGTRLHEMEGTGRLAAIPLSQPLDFYGQLYPRLWGASYGWLSFSDPLPTTNAKVGAPNLPRAVTLAPSGPLIAAFWTAATCDRQLFDCKFYYEQVVKDGVSILVLQWVGYQIVNAGGITYQVQLWPNGDIVVAIGEVDNPHRYLSKGWVEYRGETAWIGLESPDRSTYISGSYKRMMEMENRSFLFERR